MDPLDHHSVEKQGWFRRMLESLDPTQRKVALVCVVVIALGIAAILFKSSALFSSFGWWFSSSISTNEDVAPKTTYAPEAVYAQAHEKAKAWQADAQLSYLRTEGTANWKLIFTSEHPDALGRGYLVVLQGEAVIGAEEIAYIGPAADFPISDIISADEAIARVRAMEGYQHAQILGIEAVYGPSEEVWYWGVRTDKGVVTVEAKRK